MAAQASPLRRPRDHAGLADEAFSAEQLLALGLLSESHGLEHNNEGPFAWTRPRFRLRPQHAAPYMRLRFAFLASRGTLTVMRRGETIARLALRSGWQELAEVENNGYLFDYAAETLSQSELTALSPVIRQLADAHEVRTYIDWDEFEAPEQHASGEPICAEPWKTLYVLNRGILPCCYARQPLATWQEQGDRSLDDLLRDVVNSEAYQTIRSELAAGRLPHYCRAELSAAHAVSHDADFTVAALAAARARSRARGRETRTSIPTPSRIRRTRCPDRAAA